MNSTTNFFPRLKTLSVSKIFKYRNNASAGFVISIIKISINVTI